MSVMTEPLRFPGDVRPVERINTEEANRSGVTWAAVLAGAAVTAALWFIALALGAGAGLSSMSPWSGARVTPSDVGMGALIFLAVTEVICAGVGGYVAGRLRTKWTAVHSHEVYFRDTAHGFLVWAVSLVVTASFLATSITAMVGGEVVNATTSSRAGAAPVDANRYFIDRLYRAPQATTALDQALPAEAGLIFAHSLAEKTLSVEDKNYLVQTVVARTGVSQAEADARVTAAFTQAQQTADTARKAGAHALYWLFVAMLMGAFSASWAATLGGKQRDHVYA